MRTTIELPNSLRAKLLELAAKRGEKGFSTLVREAVEQYLAAIEDTEAPRERAIASLGKLSQDDAESLEGAVQQLRARWR